MYLSWDLTQRPRKWFRCRVSEKVCKLTWKNKRVASELKFRTKAFLDIRMKEKQMLSPAQRMTYGSCLRLRVKILSISSHPYYNLTISLRKVTYFFIKILCIYVISSFFLFKWCIWTCLVWKDFFYQNFFIWPFNSSNYPPKARRSSETLKLRSLRKNNSWKFCEKSSYSPLNILFLL